MQTFLPDANFELSAMSLDRKRLGKQRVECKQILTSLIIGGGWINHPAVVMWRGHEPMLALYGFTICEEWRKRGYKDTLRSFFADLVGPTRSPWWLGNEAFHVSHRSNLIRKDPEWYTPFWPGTPLDLDYLWPTSISGEFRTIPRKT